MGRCSRKIWVSRNISPRSCAKGVELHGEGNLTHLSTAQTFKSTNLSRTAKRRKWPFPVATRRTERTHSLLKAIGDTEIALRLSITVLKRACSSMAFARGSVFSRTYARWYSIMRCGTTASTRMTISGRLIPRPYMGPIQAHPFAAAGIHSIFALPDGTYYQTSMIDVPVFVLIFICLH